MDVAAAEEPTPAADSPEELQAERDRVWAEAQSLRSEGKLTEAAAAGEQMLVIERRWLGEDSADVVGSLEWLAGVYEEAEDWPAAEAKRTAALSWRERRQGSDNWQTVDARLAVENLRLLKMLTAADLARLRDALVANEEIDRLYGDGQYAKTIELATKALAIRKAVLGERHPDYATSLNNLAALYRATGDYARAEPLYRHAREIRKTILGQQHPDYATSLNNLAALYRATGDYARAEPLFQQASDIDRVALGEQHPGYAIDLNNLADLYDALGDYARAEPLYRQALEIRKTVLGQQHPDYAASLDNLGQLYRTMGDFAQAEPLITQASQIYKTVRGAQHPDYATSLDNLAGLYRATGDYARAERLSRQALEIYKSALGEQHPDYATGLNNLAALYRTMGDDARARPLFRQALEIAAAHGEMTAVVQDEQGQLALGRSVKIYLDSYVSCLLRIKRGDEAAYGAALNWKGATLVRQRMARVMSESPELAPLFVQLQSVVRQWSALAGAPALAGPGWKKQLDDLVRRKEQLGADLSARSTAYRAATAKVTVESLQAALPADAALVDYFEFWDREPSADQPGQANWRRSLLAFVVRPGREVEMFDLGAVEPIAQAIDAWRLGYGAGADAENAGRLLREKLWTPLEGAIGDATLVLVSPDGALGKLPFAALPGAKPGTYLIEDVAVALVPVPQLIPTLMAGGDDRVFDQELLLVGGVDYDRRDVDGSDGAGSLDAGGDAPPPVGDLLAVARSRGNARQAADGQSWSALPGTSGEAAAIRQLFLTADEDIADVVTLLSGAAATEERFRELAPRSRILHVATHGFFAAEGPATALAANVPDQSGMNLLGAFPAKPPRFPPGLLSGLVLAGANAPPKLPDDPAEFAELPEDGILTAEELMFLPLNGVELVVLSACESGLGEVAGGEGLLGIQRAFQVAGARTTVATLWKVDDAMTQRLMTAFYRNVLEGKQSHLEALRNAQLEMLNELRAQHTVQTGEDEASRGVKRPEDAARLAAGAPRYWAAFTLSGDWR